MDVKFEFAVVGFCSDLTDPKIPSAPIALIVRVKFEGNRGGRCIVFSG